MNRNRFILQQPFVPLRADCFHMVCTDRKDISVFYEFTVKDGKEQMMQAVPDGAVDLLFSISETHVHSAIGGTVLGVKRWPMDIGGIHFGVRFRPGECTLPKGMTIQDVVNTDVEIETDWFGTCLAERLAGCHSFAERVAVFQQCFGNEAHTEINHPTAYLEHYIRRRIYETHGMIPMKSLAEESGYSECYLRRVFGSVHGISPKQFETFLRFQYVLHHMKTQTKTLEEIALECGYYDQSHMIKDFKKFSGTTPEQYYHMIPQTVHSNEMEVQ